MENFYQKCNYDQLKYRIKQECDSLPSPIKAYIKDEIIRICGLKSPTTYYRWLDIPRFDASGKENPQDIPARALIAFSHLLGCPIEKLCNYRDEIHPVPKTKFYKEDNV